MGGDVLVRASAMVVPIPVGMQRRRPWRVGSTVATPEPPVPEQAPDAVGVAARAAGTFIVVLLGGLLVFAIIPLLLGYGSVVVTSGSMGPAISTGDIVVTAPPDDIVLESGTVVNYRRGDDSVLHRIVAAEPVGYRTAGDANHEIDSGIVTRADVEGVGIVVVPFAGWPSVWIARGQWFPLGLLVVLLVLAAHVVFHPFRGTNKL